MVLASYNVLTYFGVFYCYSKYNTKSEMSFVLPSSFDALHGLTSMLSKSVGNDYYKHFRYDIHHGYLQVIYVELK